MQLNSLYICIVYTCVVNKIMSQQYTSKSYEKMRVTKNKESGRPNKG